MYLNRKCIACEQKYGAAQCNVLASGEDGTKNAKYINAECISCGCCTASVALAPAEAPLSRRIIVNKFYNLRI